MKIKHDLHTCSSCSVTCASKNILNTHILEHHKTHKPCINFAVGTCEYKEECRFRHIKLKEKELICYKCGKIVTTVKALMRHIKEKHGSEPCKKYALNECARGAQCWYSHNMLQAHSRSTYSRENQVFQETPTMRPYS